MGESVSVRHADSGDARSIERLQREIYGEGRWFVGEGPPPEAALARRLRYLDPAQSLVLVATSGGEVRGWLELNRLQPRRMNHVAVLTIAITRDWRRRGLARRLLRASYEWARQVGVRKISLNVRANNTGAIRLYESEGFVQEGRERDQIQLEVGFEDNLIMARYL